MEVLIKNMKMPKTDSAFPTWKTLRITSDGDVWVIHDDEISMSYTGSEAIELPPHGRLGDLDLVEEWMRKKHKEHDCPFNIDAFLFALKKFPTIVEATE